MTHIIAIYPGIEGTESHVAEIDGGFSASLWDTDAGEAVGVVVFRSSRFYDAESLADKKAREFVCCS